MNGKAVANILGKVLLAEAALLLFPLAAAAYFREPVLPFLGPILLLLLLGGALAALKPASPQLYAREGFVCVGLSWVLMSAFGALPFVFSGDIPRYTDALFETVSGFTTTGASILNDPERLGRGCMFWRLFTHWIGGMGVLVFIAAILPVSGDHYIHIMRAEVPGPTVSKLVPRIRKTARILYLIYFGLTLLECLLLLLGMIAFAYCVVKIFFANIKRGGILLTQIAVGSLYMFSVPRGYTDGFYQWCKQVAGLCLTAFLQTTLLFLGLLTFSQNMLLGLGIMLSAKEVPKIAQQFGLDTSAHAHLTSVIHTTSMAIHMGRAIAAK